MGDVTKLTNKSNKNVTLDEASKLNKEFTKLVVRNVTIGEKTALKVSY